MVSSSGARTTQRHLVIVAVMASMFMIAIEATIVSTAMPQIAGQLGDLHLYSWVFSSFLLTQTATTVVFGNGNAGIEAHSAVVTGNLVYSQLNTARDAIEDAEQREGGEA